jgi:hypothetical protein
MEIEDLFQGAFVFLLSDQFEDGLWGRSIKQEEKFIKPAGKPTHLYATEKEALGSEKTTGVKSITVSFMAANAILGFTRNPKNIALENLLQELPEHKEKENTRENYGGYGTKKVSKSDYDKNAKVQIIDTERHTACALRIVLLLNKLEKSDNSSLKYLLDRMGSGGGWPKDEPTVLTTIYVLGLLSSLKKFNIFDLPAGELDKLIDHNVEWLGTQLVKNQYAYSKMWSFGDSQRTLRDTAEVLYAFPDLQAYRKPIYDSVLKSLSESQNTNPDDLGWPASPDTRSDLGATIWITYVLAESRNPIYTEKVNDGLKFIANHMVNGSEVEELSSEHWALLVDLAKFKLKVPIDKPLEKSLAKLATEIQEIFDRGSIEILKEKRYARFPFLEPAMLRALKNQGVAIKHTGLFSRINIWYDNLPRWARWMIGTLGTVVVGLILSRIFGIRI